MLQRILFLILIAIIYNNCKKYHNEINVNLDYYQKSINEKIFKEKRYIPENIGYVVFDLDENEVLESFNEDKFFIPASTIKILTTIAALDILGKDYRYKTFLSYDGYIKNHVLHGNIYLKGTGDPLFTVSDLMVMAQKVAKMGIKKVNGNFFYDESDLIRADKIDKTMHIDASYNTGISSLSLDYNSIYAEWEPDYKKRYKRKKNENDVNYFLIPSLPVNSIGLSMRELPENIKFTYRRTGGHEKWLLTPEIDRKGRSKLPVKKPAQHTAWMFVKMCQLNGIEIGNPVPGVMSQNNDIIHVHEGLPLLDQVSLILTYSNNLMAELLLLSTAKKITGKTFGLEESAAVISDYISKRITGIDWDGFYLKNGSGLTSETRISPSQMLGILLYANTKKYDDKSFISLLPISGWKWSLRTRLNDPETAFHVWAKTGAINYALSLSGYAFTNSNKKLLFSFFMNDYKLRKKYENDPQRRCKKSEKKVIRWTRKYRALMDNVIESWIKKF